MDKEYFMDFLEAMNFRHATKSFDKNKKISEANKQAIVEFGRLSPSSFGIEPWHFLVVSSQELREKIKPACWNQDQLTSSSFVVIYLSYLPHHFRGDTPFLKQRLMRRSRDEERYLPFLNMVTTYLSAQNTGEWAKRQSYIPLANMMTGAASLGIDSCPIEGFEVEKIKPLLANHVDWNKFDITAITAFGYRAAEQTPRFREDSSSVVTHI